jgi:hypothetical protein
MYPNLCFWEKLQCLTYFIELCLWNLKWGYFLLIGYIGPNTACLNWLSNDLSQSVLSNYHETFTAMKPHPLHYVPNDKLLINYINSTYTHRPALCNLSHKFSNFFDSNSPQTVQITFNQLYIHYILTFIRWLYHYNNITTWIWYNITIWTISITITPSVLTSSATSFWDENWQMKIHNWQHHNIKKIIISNNIEYYLISISPK